MIRLRDLWDGDPQTAPDGPDEPSEVDLFLDWAEEMADADGLEAAE